MTGDWCAWVLNDDNRLFKIEGSSVYFRVFPLGGGYVWHARNRDGKSKQDQPAPTMGRAIRRAASFALRGQQVTPRDAKSRLVGLFLGANLGPGDLCCVDAEGNWK
jgi:hypothetical protein